MLDCIERFWARLNHVTFKIMNHMYCQSHLTLKSKMPLNVQNQATNIDTNQ